MKLVSLFYSRLRIVATLLLFICFSSSVVLASKMLIAEAGLPQYFGTSYYDVARALIDSTVVCEGAIQINPGSPASGDPTRTVSGKIIIGRKLYGVNGGPGQSVPFERSMSSTALGLGESMFNAPFHGWGENPLNGVRVIVFLKQVDNTWSLFKAVPADSNEGRLLVSELDQLQISGIRADNSSALNQPLDPKMHPLAEAVRVRLLKAGARK